MHLGGICVDWSLASLVGDESVLPYQRPPLSKAWLKGEADLEDSLEYTRKLGADRVAVFGYAHVPHLVPRQAMIPEDALPGAAARFTMASQAHAMLTGHGYDAIGFDHFALPHDPMARAVRSLSPVSMTTCTPMPCNSRTAWGLSSLITSATAITPSA